MGEVGEGDSSGPRWGASGAKPGGGGTQPKLRPSTRLVERPGRREMTPDGLQSEGLRLQSPEEPQPGLDSASPWSDGTGASAFSDRRLCGNGSVKAPENAGRRPTPAAGIKSLPSRFVGSRPEPHPHAENPRFQMPGTQIWRFRVYPRPRHYPEGLSEFLFPRLDQEGSPKSERTTISQF